jgi:CRP-like cAMP-binding protein
VGTNYDVLKVMGSLADAPDESVRWLADHVDLVHFEPGDTLIREGATDRDCYFIVSGVTEVTFAGTSLGPTGPGEPEGEMALFFRRVRSGTTVAISAVDALRLRADDYDAFDRARPAVAAAFRAAVLHHLSSERGITADDSAARVRALTGGAP